MSASPLASSALNRNRSQLRRLAFDARWLLAGVVVLGVANFFWQLGSSSYFIDEIFTIQHSSGSLHSVISQVSHTEATPWTYFLVMHEWLYRIGSSSEWIVRLPSAIAGVGLVIACYWMALAFLDRPGALGVAGLTALSPLVLQYAQQARVYVFVTLAVTVAVAATLHAPSAPGRRSLLVIGAVCSVLALWLHYTAAFVIGPLCAWVGFQRDLPARTRITFIGACALAEAALIPLFVFQRDHAPPGVFPGTQASKIVHILETPFDGRFTNGVNAVRVLAAILVLSAVAVITSRLGRAVKRRWLLIGLSVIPPLAIIAIGLGGDDVIITRYTVVAAPFILTTIIAAARVIPFPGRLGLAAVTLLVTFAGLIDSHRQSGFYPPTKTAAAYVAVHRTADEPVLLSTPDLVLTYYLERDLPGHPSIPAGNTTTLLAIAARLHRPVWLITDLGSGDYTEGALQHDADRFLVALRYHTTSVRIFRASTEIADFQLTPGQ